MRITGNTQPIIGPQADRGPVDPATPMDKLILVLKRSPEQEAALTAFNKRQCVPASPDFHLWLRSGKHPPPSPIILDSVIPSLVT
jgi:hypothetical protein